MLRCNCFSVVGVKCRALRVLTKHSTSEVYPKFSFSSSDLINLFRLEFELRILSCWGHKPTTPCPAHHMP